MPSALVEHAPMSEVARDGARQRGASALAMKDAVVARVPSEDAVAVARRKTRTWDYIWRSGVSGGLAGCAVRPTRSGGYQGARTNLIVTRPRLSLRRLTESRSSSKPAIRSLQNTRALGSAWPLQ